MNGQKMSKTIGNVYDPMPVLNKLGADPLRYYCLAKISPFADGDFSEEKFYTSYNSDLANGIGNLVSRVATMAEKISLFVPETKSNLSVEVTTALDLYQFDRALKAVWLKIKEADTLINERKVWALKGEEQKEILTDLVKRIRQIGIDLQPFLPETAEKIVKQFAGEKIIRGENLFNRL